MYSFELWAQSKTITVNMQTNDITLNIPNFLSVQDQVIFLFYPLIHIVLLPSTTYLHVKLFCSSDIALVWLWLWLNTSHVWINSLGVTGPLCVLTAAAKHNGCSVHLQTSLCFNLHIRMPKC